MSRNPQDRIHEVLRVQLDLIESLLNELNIGTGSQFSQENEETYSRETFQRDYDDILNILAYLLTDKGLLEHNFLMNCRTSNSRCSDCGCAKCETMTRFYQQILSDIVTAVKIKHSLSYILIASEFLSDLPSMGGERFV